MKQDVSTLSVPAAGSWLDVIRLFVTSVAETCGLGSDAVDDLRLVVTEICADAPGTSNGGVAIEVSADDGYVSIRCEGVMPLVRSDNPADPQVLRARVLEALIPEATWLRNGDEPASVLFGVAMA